MTAAPKDTVKAEVHRCPNCGTSDVSLDESQGKLKCNYCRHVFDAESVNKTGGVAGLKGNVVGEGASNIVPGEDVIATLRCPSCGAEVVVNASENLSINCHWCRHVLTINNKIPNGAVPDFVLPFKIKHEAAVEKIKEYVQKKCGVNYTSQLGEVTVETVEGVYFPYMVVDVRAHMEFAGVSEKTKASHGSTYDIEAYDVIREFDILVDDLTVESSSKRLNQDLSANSNNIINAIMPFDVENAVAWDANYLRGYHSEKRDVNIEGLKEVVASQVGDIARIEAKKTMDDLYDRGTHWQREHLGIKGAKWKAAYLPVWLFSYRRASDGRVFYAAMNGRTGEISGYFPDPKEGIKKAESKAPLIIASIIVALLTLKTIVFFLAFMILVKIIQYASAKGGEIKTAENSRHFHERETKATIENLKKKDTFRQERKGVYQKEIPGRNDTRALGSLSTGRSQMSAIEKQRLSMGSNARMGGSSIKAARGSLIKMDIISLLVAGLMSLIMMGGGYSGGSYYSGDSSDSGYSSSYSDYDWGSSSSSSWDWGSSSSDYDYGGYDSGFDYSYDYDW